MDAYLAASHAGFRRGRSTADIIWAHRWLAAKAIRYKAMIYILGLDMSRAFDTIDRAKLMSILRNEVRLEEDDLRMCQSLLADTNLKVKLGQALSDQFTTIPSGRLKGTGFPLFYSPFILKAL